MGGQPADRISHVVPLRAARSFRSTPAPFHSSYAGCCRPGRRQRPLRRPAARRQFASLDQFFRTVRVQSWDRMELDAEVATRAVPRLDHLPLHVPDQSAVLAPRGCHFGLARTHVPSETVPSLTSNRPVKWNPPSVPGPFAHMLLTIPVSTSGISDAAAASGAAGGSRSGVASSAPQPVVGRRPSRASRASGLQWRQCTAHRHPAAIRCNQSHESGRGAAAPLARQRAQSPGNALRASPSEAASPGTAASSTSRQPRQHRRWTGDRFPPHGRARARPPSPACHRRARPGGRHPWPCRLLSRQDAIRSGARGCAARHHGETSDGPEHRGLPLASTHRALDERIVEEIRVGTDGVLMRQIVHREAEAGPRGRHTTRGRRRPDATVNTKRCQKALPSTPARTTGAPPPSHRHPGPSRRESVHQVRMDQHPCVGEGRGRPSGLVDVIVHQPEQPVARHLEPAGHRRVPDAASRRHRSGVNARSNRMLPQKWTVRPRSGWPAQDRAARRRGLVDQVKAGLTRLLDEFLHGIHEFFDTRRFVARGKSRFTSAGHSASSSSHGPGSVCSSGHLPTVAAPGSGYRAPAGSRRGAARSRGRG